jgi:hypothetical protein
VQSAVCAVDGVKLTAGDTRHCVWPRADIEPGTSTGGCGGGSSLRGGVVASTREKDPRDKLWSSCFH